MRKLSLQASTQASTPPNQLDIEALDLVLNEEKRYKRKGYGIVFASLIVASVIVLIPELGKAYWQSLLELGNIQLTYFIASNLIHVLMIIIPNLVLNLIYSIKLPFFERYRIESRPWLWEESPQLFKQQMRKAYKTLFLNVGIISPVLVFVQLIINNGVPQRTDFETFPNRMEFVLQLIFSMFCEDFFFYWGHRTLHRPYFYGKIHKQHHEFIQPIGLASQYSHPLEFFIANSLPMASGPMFLGKRMHMFTRLCWLTLRLGETVDGHCGYEFSWSPYRLLPFSGKLIQISLHQIGSAHYHNYHHTHNIGNYGSFFSIWDSVFGTNKHYFRYYHKVEKLRDQLDKQEKGSNLKQEKLKEKLEKYKKSFSKEKAKSE